MASPNAAFRLRLERSPVYEVISPSQRQTWLSVCLSLGEEKTRKPGHKETFEGGYEECWNRLFHWGLTAGCLFAKGRHRTGNTPTREYFCKFHGDKIDNTRGLKDIVVRKDP